MTSRKTYFKCIYTHW